MTPSSMPIRFSLLPMAARMKVLRWHLSGALSMGVIYWVLASYARTLGALGDGRSYIWPADGLALGALLCVRRRFWPMYLLVVFLINLATSNAPLPQSILYATFNVIEPLLVAAMITFELGERPRIDSVKSVLIVFFSVIGVMAAATLLTSYMNSLIYQRNFLHVWTTWYVADTLGMLIIGPLVVCLSCQWRYQWENLFRPRLLEAATVLLGLIGLTHLFFAVLPYLADGGLNLSSTPMIGPAFFMLWAAIRFGLTGAVVTIAIQALQTYWYTAHGLGPIAMLYPHSNTSLVHLQASLLMLDFLALMIAAVSVERHHAYVESDVARNRLEFAIKASDMLVFDTSPSTNRISWSGDTVAVLGQPATALADVNAWVRRIHYEDRDLVVRKYTALTRGETTTTTYDFRIRFNAADAWQSVGVVAYAVPIKWRLFGTGVGEIRIIGFLKNVTAKKIIEDKNLVLEERLRQAEKMEAIGGLAGGIAHDFNNIMGAILGYAEMAQAKLANGTEARRYVDTIAMAGERGKALVAQILTFSRVNRTEVERIDITDLIAEVISILRGSMPTGVRIFETVPSTPLFVMGNGTHLYQLAMNLAANGIQAMPNGGEFRIAVSAVENMEELVLQAGCLARGRYVVLTFEDQGVGIDKELLPRIFEPFFSTRIRENGTGLGLAIVHGVVLAHGGAIDVQSVRGHGSIFTVYLPECPTMVGRQGGPLAIPRGGGETVLVVDDEAAMVALAEDLLAGLGYEPVGFTSAKEALSAYLDHPARFDAVMTDEVMPEITGTELIAKLHEVTPELPTVVVSGFGGAGFEMRARAAGVLLVLRKPYRKLDLARAMAAILAGRS